MRSVFFLITTMLLATMSVSVIAANKAPVKAMASNSTLFGFTPFPYDFTAEAVERTQAIIVPNSTIYALHLDDGIPWKEVMADKPLPEKVQKEWNDWSRAIPAGHAVYVGLSPLGKDRKTLAPAPGEQDNSSLPSELRDARLDDPKVKQAFLTYARRAIKQFNPDFLNIGIEAGELAARDPKRWPQFEALYDYVRGALKNEFPNLKIGMSFGLQSLRKPSVARMVKPLIERSDYLGLSFYPHMSPFGEKFGDPPLSAGTAAWREPLAWVRSYTTKPIALCETGFSTQNTSIKSFDLELRGDPASQAAYVRELIQTAKRDNYLFVVWFLAVDYDKLYAKMPKGAEVNLLWRNIGLFDGELRPKPAWEEWKGFASTKPAVAAPIALPAPQAAIRPVAQSRASIARIGFQNQESLFSCAPGSSVTLDTNGPEQGMSAMKWAFRYQNKEWQWCTKNIGAGKITGANSLHVWVRSDREGQVFLQLEEQNGEAFFALITAGSKWQRVTLKLSELSLDATKKRNGKLDADQVSTVLLADAAGRENASGNRTLWFADLSFE